MLLWGWSNLGLGDFYCWDFFPSQLCTHVSVSEIPVRGEAYKVETEADEVWWARGERGFPKGDRKSPRTQRQGFGAPCLHPGAPSYSLGSPKYPHFIENSPLLCWVCSSVELCHLTGTGAKARQVEGPLPATPPSARGRFSSLNRHSTAPSPLPVAKLRRGGGEAGGRGLTTPHTP